MDVLSLLKQGFFINKLNVTEKKVPTAGKRKLPFHVADFSGLIPAHSYQITKGSTVLSWAANEEKLPRLQYVTAYSWRMMIGTVNFIFR